MILLDVNILIYATAPSVPQHEAARAWLDRQFAANVRIGMPWLSLLGFVRVTTNRKAFTSPARISDAWETVKHWIAESNVWIPTPGDQHMAILDRLFQTPGLTHEHVQDVHLAALAIEHGLVLCSSDTDFARFPGVRWMNPLLVPPGKKK